MSNKNKKRANTESSDKTIPGQYKPGTKTKLGIRVGEGKVPRDHKHRS